MVRTRGCFMRFSRLGRVDLGRVEDTDRSSTVARTDGGAGVRSVLRVLSGVDGRQLSSGGQPELDGLVYAVVTDEVPSLVGGEVEPLGPGGWLSARVGGVHGSGHAPRPSDPELQRHSAVPTSPVRLTGVAPAGVIRRPAGIR